MKYLLTTIFFLAAIFSNYLSCVSEKNEKLRNGADNKVVCVLFDMSLSTNKQEVRQAYSDNIRKILNNMNPGDAIVGALITAASLSEPEFGIQYEFHTFKPSTDNPLYQKGEKNAFYEKFTRLKDSLFHRSDSILKQFNKHIMKTEIISALSVAARVFKTYQQERKILVIMSDMVEESDKYNFRRENLTNKRIDQIIQYEKRENYLPELKKVKIYVSGAASRNTKRFLQIRNFWAKYFEACGANLASKNYGSILIKFDE